MSQESSATELEVAMLYSEVLENDVWLRRLHEGVAVAKAVVAERKAAASGGGARKVVLCKAVHVEKRQKKAEKGARIDISTTHRIAAGMTATKYNSKHRIVDEHEKRGGDPQKVSILWNPRASNIEGPRPLGHG